MRLLEENDAPIFPLHFSFHNLPFPPGPSYHVGLHARESPARKLIPRDYVRCGERHGPRSRFVPLRSGARMRLSRAEAPSGDRPRTRRSGFEFRGEHRSRQWRHETRVEGPVALRVTGRWIPMRTSRSRGGREPVLEALRASRSQDRSSSPISAATCSTSRASRARVDAGNQLVKTREDDSRTRIFTGACSACLR